MLEFASQCARAHNQWQVEEEVRLDINLKNVKQITVQLFEINTTNYYKLQKKQVTSPQSVKIKQTTREKQFQINLSDTRRGSMKSIKQQNFEHPKTFRANVTICLSPIGIFDVTLICDPFFISDI